MPSASIMAFAKKTGKPESEVERLWKKAKELALKGKSKSDPDYWGYTVGILKKMLGIKSEDVQVPISALEMLAEQDGGGGATTAGAGGTPGKGEYAGVTPQGTQGAQDGSKATTTKDYPVIPVAGGHPLKPLKRVTPDCVVHGLDCFNVTKEDFIGMARARQNGQRYPIKDERVKQYMRENSYRRPFALQHEGNLIKISKPTAK